MCFCVAKKRKQGCFEHCAHCPFTHSFIHSLELARVLWPLNALFVFSSCLSPPSVFPAIFLHLLTDRRPCVSFTSLTHSLWLAGDCQLWVFMVYLTCCIFSDKSRLHSGLHQFCQSLTVWVAKQRWVSFKYSQRVGCLKATQVTSRLPLFTVPSLHIPGGKKERRRKTIV